MLKTFQIVAFSTLFFLNFLLAEDRPSDKEIDLPEFPSSSDASFVLPPLEQQEKNLPISAQFKLKQILFSGNTVYSDEQLLEQCQEFIDKTLSLGELETIRFKLTRFYVDSGYINSGVLLPDQHIVDGKVKFQVIEGKISSINITGNKDLQASYISDRLLIESNKVFNKNHLQNGFQSLLTDPLIKRLNGELKPGRKIGEGVLDLKITRNNPYQFEFSLDNHHATSSGEVEGQFNTVYRNLTGYGDAIAMELGVTEGNNSFTGSYQFPLSAKNNKIYFEFSRNDSSVTEDSLKNADIESDYTSYSLGYFHPIIQSSKQELSLDLSFTWRKSQTYFLGVGTPFSAGVNDDGKAKTAVIRFSQNYSQRFDNWVIAARSTFNIGVDAFNATINPDNLADSQFFSWIGQFQYARKLKNNSGQIIFKTDLQLSNHHLLSLEQIAIGGPKSVRGYRANQFITDNGLDLSLEYRYPLLGSPFNKKAHSIQLATFIDAGNAWNKGETISTHKLSSAGIGLLWAKQSFSAELYWAHPLSNTDGNLGNYIQDEGISFRLAAKF